MRTECFFLACLIGLITVGAVFVSGVFETFIVRNCTKCGATGPLIVLCHLYAGLLSGHKPPLLSMRRLGVMHEHILCKKCFNEIMDLVLPIPRY